MLKTGKFGIGESEGATPTRAFFRIRIGSPKFLQMGKIIMK
jgi:hypothetical protein